MTTRSDVIQVLKEVRKRLTQRELAKRLAVTPKTISRWETGKIQPKQHLMPALRDEVKSDLIPEPVNPEFTFIDLFAGIGGIRMGFQYEGGKCLFTSEWNDYSRKTYSGNFSTDDLNHQFAGDITNVRPGDIPSHDVLLAGFPCQPFSIAGVSKKNSLGRAHGFDCNTQGTLFFDIEKIIAAKRPKAFLLENVKNLQSHDGGRTWEVIKYVLEKKLRYTIFTKVIDGRGFVPQHRERILIVGFREPVLFNWNAFQFTGNSHPIMSDILHKQGEEPEGHYTKIGRNGRLQVDERYTLSDKLWKYLQDYSAKHKAKGNGFGFGMVKGTDVARTLSARYYKDGSEILVFQGTDRNPRRLTPRECARLMGFDQERKYNIPVSDTQAYKQFGNAVIVPVIREVARIMKPHIMALKMKERAPRIEASEKKTLVVA